MDGSVDSGDDPTRLNHFSLTPYFSGDNLTHAPRFLGYKSGRAFHIECVRRAKLSQCFLLLPPRQEYVEVCYDGEHRQYQERGS
jgi:hypothetical protein